MTGGAFGVFGLAFLAVAAYFWVQHARFEDTAVRVTGQVSGHHQGSTRGSSESARTTYYRAMVSFPIGDGTYSTFLSTDRSPTLSPPLGAKVQVLYPPGKPDQARVIGSAGLIPIAACVFGGLLLGVGVLILTVGGRRPRRNPGPGL